MSGSTAVAVDFSMIVENLPGLFGCASKILDLLAPRATVAGDAAAELETIVKKIKISGSRLAKQLKHVEDKFQLEKDPYFTPNDGYIDVASIVSKILGNDASYGPFRPDPILQAANLATLVKEVLVWLPASQHTWLHLKSLALTFPKPFIGDFDSACQFGKSALVDDTFDMELDIRTQCAIASLINNPNWAPELTIAQEFSTTPGDGLEDLEDAKKNGWRGMGAEAIGEDNMKVQISKVGSRIDLLRKSFAADDNDGDEAPITPDHVSSEMLEKLDELFPWSAFLSSVVRWARLRLAETNEAIEQQGGIENIVKTLVGAVQNLDSQIEIDYEPPPSTMRIHELLPAANIVGKRYETHPCKELVLFNSNDLADLERLMVVSTVINSFLVYTIKSEHVS